MTEKILVAIDGSNHAEKALDLAIEMANKHDAELMILHVVTDAKLTAGQKRFAAAEHIEGPPKQQYYQLVAKPLLRKAKARACNEGLDQVSSLVVEGDPATTIVGTAQEHSVDFIVMGSRGLSDVQGLVMGSVSHKVAGHVDCTCVAVT